MGPWVRERFAWVRKASLLTIARGIPALIDAEPTLAVIQDLPQRNITAVSRQSAAAQRAQRQGEERESFDEAHDGAKKNERLRVKSGWQQESDWLERTDAERSACKMGEGEKAKGDRIKGERWGIYAWLDILLSDFPSVVAPR